MVAKISSGSSLYGALSYNQIKVDEEKAKVLCANKIRESVDGNFNLCNCMTDFMYHMPQEMRTEKPVIHISLNPHPDDKLDDNQLTAIAEQYMKKMGYENQPYIVYKHEDISRHHIHIVSLQVDETGKKISDSNNFYKSREVLRELEEEYNLIPAEKQKQSEVYHFKKNNPDDGNIKQQVANIIKPISSSYNFQSFNEYKTLLSLYNINVEEVKGNIKGKTYNGIIYSATNDKGKKIGNPFKSSLFGKSVGYDAIHKKIEKSKIEIKSSKQREQTRTQITSILNNSPNKKTFIAELSANNIDVVFRENEEKRIYGVTFIDHNNNCVFNGSHLGKEFSANSFNNIFNIHNTQNDNDFEYGNQNQSNSTSNAIFEIFTLDNGGGEEDEQVFKRNLKKNMNKKKQRKL